MSGGGSHELSADELMGVEDGSSGSEHDPPLHRPDMSDVNRSVYDELIQISGTEEQQSFPRKTLSLWLSTVCRVKHCFFQLRPYLSVERVSIPSIFGT